MYNIVISADGRDVYGNGPIQYDFPNPAKEPLIDLSTSSLQTSEIDVGISELATVVHPNLPFIYTVVVGPGPKLDIVCRITHAVLGAVGLHFSSTGW